MTIEIGCHNSKLKGGNNLPREGVRTQTWETKCGDAP